MHLPDDVALTTSGHHGSQLATLYSFWGDWLEAIGDDQDELFIGMLDGADCFQASTFDALHGYYRSALSNLRSALELVAIGTLGNLSPNDEDYVRWKKMGRGSLPFSSVVKKLRRAAKHLAPTLILTPKSWLDVIYDELCAYTHSRPDASDGQLWRSNGPIYVRDAFNLAFRLQTTIFAACYVLTKIGRPSFSVPEGSRILFDVSEAICRREIALSFHSLYGFTPPQSAQGSS